jgi:CRISPR-associated protein Cmr5
MRTRDQQRAMHAYARVEAAHGKGKAYRGDYKVQVFGLGPHVMRSGLAGALSFIERDARPAARDFLTDLADAGVPGLQTSTDPLPARVRHMVNVDDYMLATREVLKLALWFRRAVQATFPPGEDEPRESGS